MISRDKNPMMVMQIFLELRMINQFALKIKTIFLFCWLNNKSEKLQFVATICYKMAIILQKYVSIMVHLIYNEEIVLSKIYTFRGQKVMLDRDLANLYGIETKRLKETVRRNSTRFPEDFMFELNDQEFQNWRTQFATSKSDKMGLRIPPMAFTEHGVLMLSSVLNSEKAIEVNIQIMRIFSKIRRLLLDNTELRLIIEEIRKKTENNTKNIELVFQYLDELIEKQENPPKRNEIGFNR